MKVFKKILKWFGVAILLLLVVAGSLYMIYLRPFIEKMKQINTIQYDTELTIVEGGGGNSGILTSDSLVLVIDTKMDEAAEVLYNQVKEIAGNKPIFVVNTHIHPDHTKGNKFYKGQTILAGGNYNPEMWIKDAGAETLPTRWLKDSMTIKMGNETVTLLNLAKDVHTESDVFVYLHKRKMLFTGDVVLNKQAPVLMGKANPEGYLTVFNEIPNKFNVQTIVPGHGKVGGLEVLESFKQFFNDMKLAATDKSQKDALVKKYSDWNQIPIFMSPAATISHFQQ